MASSTSRQPLEALRIDPVVALRSATHALHEQLERSLPLGRLTATLADYCTHLTVRRDWQQILGPWLARTTLDPAAMDFLEQDLIDCLVPPSIHALDAPPALPAPDLAALRRLGDGRAGFCWGIAYVVEGSRLSGQVLYRRLAQQLALHFLRYLSQCGSSSPSWPEMLACLRARLATDFEVELACGGAVAAFELLLLRFKHAGCIA